MTTDEGPFPPTTNATANRMHNEAADHVSDIANEIAEELTPTHEGKPVEAIVPAVQDAWDDKTGDAVPPLPDHVATDLAEHIGAGKEGDAPAPPVVQPE